MPDSVQCVWRREAKELGLRICMKVALEEKQVAEKGFDFWKLLHFGYLESIIMTDKGGL